MYSVRDGFLAPPIILPPRDPTLGGLIRPEKTEKLDRVLAPPIILPPRDPTLGGLIRPEKKDQLDRACPPVVLPPRDPTIGLKLVDKCDKLKEGGEQCKMVFLPERMDIDKINEYYRNEDLKIINANKQKEKTQIKPRQQNSARPSPNTNKGCRKALFKPSKISVRCSFRSNRTSILRRKSTVSKNMTNISEGLLDSSLVEEKIFNSKSQAGFKFKSPSAVLRKNISKLQVKPQKKKETPRDLEKKPAATTTTTTSAKRTVVGSSKKTERPCKESITDNLKEIKDLFALELGNLRKDFDAFKKAQEDRLVKIEDLLRKLELISCKCKCSDDPSPTVTAKANENRTPVKSMRGRVDALRVSTLKKTVHFDRNMKAINMYESMRQDCSMVLSTPKITREGALLESPTPKDPKKIMSRKILQQCLMLQDTPMKK